MGLRPFIGRDLLQAIGGAAVVETMVDGLYDRLSANADLRALFGRDMARGRQEQKRFFAEWLGGDSQYSDTAYYPLMHRHDLIAITQARASQWLSCFEEALLAAVPNDIARSRIYEHVSAMAFAMVNEGENVSDLRQPTHGSCLRYKPAVKSIEFARQGDENAMKGLLLQFPQTLASKPHAAHLLHLAVRGGHLALVKLLLDLDVDVNKPSPVALARSQDFEKLIFVTPLCMARLKSRTDVEDLLLGWAAKEDIFTHAILGDIPALQNDLANGACPPQVCDTAVDVLFITPIHHAVAGGQLQALRLLLEEANRRGEVMRNLNRALRVATAHQQIDAVDLLLLHGADPKTVGAGRWVLNAPLAAKLVEVGACIDRSGSWIRLACTGNQGRKDDPEYVAALLRYGARANDRDNREGSVANLGPTALHYAARAGFVRTIALLMREGADPQATDEQGLTPIDWVHSAAKSVDRDAVRHVLRQAT